MAYVQGELGDKINKLMKESDDVYRNGDYELSIKLLEDAWDLLPDGKNEYDESFLIVWNILDTAIYIKDEKVMKKWVDKIFTADPERRDAGEREMWAGRVEYECNNLDKAMNYFEIANKKSGGRCFLQKDKKYKEFYISEKIK